MNQKRILGAAMCFVLVASYGSETSGSPISTTPSNSSSTLSSIHASSSSGGVVFDPILVKEPTLVTSGRGSPWQEGEVTEVNTSASVTVDDTTTYQNWHGFGGTFNEAGWDALLDVSEPERNRAMTLLFDSEGGAGFTYGRIPIGSSDYAMDRYSLAETVGDYRMENFSINRDKKLLIPFIKAALAVKPDIKFWASPWAPPVWMMDINPEEKYPNDSGTMKSDARSLQAHALYLARFVEEYNKEGIEIEAVHPQNEPGWAQHYPSCAWPGSLMRDYIANHLGPLFAKRLPSVEVWLGTVSNTESASMITSVMSNVSSSQYVKGLGLQWGMEVNAASYVLKYDVPIIQTEHRCGNYPWSGGAQGKDDIAPNDYAYGLESWGLIKSWIHAGVNSYLAWNMILDKSGANLDEQRIWHQNSLLVVDRSSGKLIVTAAYYVFRHLAQYVEPGAVRVKVSDGDALAFKNPDGSIVTILHNSGDSAKNTTLAVAGKKLQFQIPASGWATVNWQ